MSPSTPPRRRARAASRSLNSARTPPCCGPAGPPSNPSFAAWKYAFWHTASDEEARALFEREVVPESRLVGKGPLGAEARIDFGASRAPLLLLGGELDHIIPAPLNEANAKRYDASRAPTSFRTMPGRTHALCFAPGWEEVADAALDFIDSL